MRFDFARVPGAPDALNRALQRLQAFLAGLTRTPAGDLRHERKLIAAGGLGVGNSAAATTPGAVTRKIEVFDADGNSLGYVAVYDAIT
ncbi:MAG TPA: hypothetical protein VF158_00005 [Longimicrobiales bacterium]